MPSAPSEASAPTTARTRGGRIALYCPELPPAPGGVADHTLLLSRALVAAGADVAVLGGTGEPGRFEPIPALTGVAPSRGAYDLSEGARRLGAIAVLVQYVPFLYGRLGLAPSLARALRRLGGIGIRVGLFVHEPFVPLTRPAWWLTGVPMRWQFRVVVRSADVVFAAVPHFLHLACRVARAGTRLVAVPVGATIPVVPAARAEARAALGLTDAEIAVGVFSPRASGLRPDWLAHAAAALGGVRARWVFFGRGSETPPDGFPPDVRSRCLGWLEPERASRVFRALDIAAAPYQDGLTLRRTSAMAALAHGIPLASSRGPLSDPALEAAALCADSAAGFGAHLARLAADAALRDTQGRRGKEIYDARGSIEVLAARVAAELGAGVAA